MGINERRKREKDLLKTKILDAATEIFLNKGIVHTSMRAIAKQIDYSVATIYLYYKDRDEILRAIRLQGVRLLLGALKKVKEQKDSFMYLKKLALTYVDFSEANPAYYDLMFITRHLSINDTKDDEIRLFYSELKERYMLPIRKCVENNSVRSNDPNQVLFNLWIYLHGMISLNLSSRLAKVLATPNTKDFMRDCLEAYFNNLKVAKFSVNQSLQ